jgi:hypothetical protein
MEDFEQSNYSEEERIKIVDYFMNIKGDLIREFLEVKKIPKSGTKPELKERIIIYIEEGKILYNELINYIDTIVPYDKQHVYLYNGPNSNIVLNWRNANYYNALLQKNNLLNLLNKRLPLILPKNLTLSSIECNGKELVIFAVERREHDERNEDYDETRIKNNEEIYLKAYIHKVTRGIIIFRWNLISNTASLYISQLPSETKYEVTEERFANLINNWLKLKLFNKVDLKPLINKLHKNEEQGNSDVRSHGFGYKTKGGRAINAQSPTNVDSVLGEDEVDTALSNIRDNSIGHTGNFYWLPKTSSTNPLEKEIHTIIIGYHNRINFTTPNKKDDFEYVLSRVRELSK